MNCTYLKKLCLGMMVIVHCGVMHPMNQPDEHYGLKCALKLAGCGISLVAMGVSAYSAYHKQREHKKNLSAYVVEAVTFVAGAVSLSWLGMSCRRTQGFVYPQVLKDIERRDTQELFETSD